VLGDRLEAMVAAVARRHGLSHAAGNALAVIEGAGGPVPVGEVGAHMHVTSGTMTSVLDTLERKHYIRRILDPTDRRKVLVDVTPEAQAVLDRLLPDVQQLAVAVFGRFDEAALTELLDTIAAVRDATEAVPDELPAAPPRRTPAHLRRR